MTFSTWHVRLLLALVAGGCGSADPRTIRVDFRQTQQGWVGDFADYPVGEDDFYELVADHRALEAPLDTSELGHFLSGNNHSDDLWMYVRGRVSGLDDHQSYHVRFEVEIATNAPMGCIGVGGSPGEGVTVKAGVSDIEPIPVMEGTDWRMNIDKGNQTSSGDNALAIGDMANSVPCGEPERWELTQLTSGTDSVSVTTDGSGSVWLFAGTDSGFEATTDVYFTWVVATFEP